MKLKGSFTQYADVEVSHWDALKALRVKVLTDAGLPGDCYVDKDLQIVEDVEDVYGSHTSVSTRVVIAEPTDEQVNLVLAFSWILSAMNKQLSQSKGK